ncbi:MAG: ROK family protein [Moorea sp. SIO4G2]|nr:ROK family protein [Moorena sp. SIO4G2]
MTQAIGVDLGGTAIKLGRFREDGTELESLTVDTPQPATPTAVIEAIVAAISRLDTREEVMGIGVGCPGPADVAGRIAKVAINLTDWHDVPLADHLEAKVGYPTVVANDANCAGLGEAWLGAGRRFRNLILLTLGTGVGGAIIFDGQLFTGHLGSAGELGLINLYPDGPEGNSGNRGSLEQYLSIRAIRSNSGKEPAELGKLAQQGNQEALEFWADYGRLLGIGLTSFIYPLTPEAIIIGGGISASAEFFLPATLAEIEQRVLPSSRTGLELLKAELGNRAGMVGAARLAWQKHVK